MWPPSQSPIGWTLIGIIIIIFFFLTFGSKTTNISFFGHLPWTLNASPNNTDHHSYFFLIFPLFYACFSSRDANVSICGNAHWTLKTVPSPHHHQSIPDFFCILMPFFIQKSNFFYIWKCTLDPETVPIHHQCNGVWLHLSLAWHWNHRICRCLLINYIMLCT